MHDNQLKEVKKAEEVEGLINRRRRQILVHSCIYYKFFDSLVDDAIFDKWAATSSPANNSTAPAT